MTSTAADKPISYAGYRFPAEVISYAVWLHFRFPLSLRMVEELLAARGIEATYETVRRWALKFGAAIARHSRANAPACGDKWHLDEVTINGQKRWLWRAVDQHGATLDVQVQSRRDRHPVGWLMRKLMKKHGRVRRVQVQAGELFARLVGTHGFQPALQVIRHHNHFSQIMAIGTGDRGLVDPVLAFLRRTLEA